MGSRLASLLWVPQISQRMAAQHFLLVLVLISAVELALDRFQVKGAADFDARNWLVSWVPFTITALLAWLAFDERWTHHTGRVGTALGLLLASSLPITVVGHSLLHISSATDGTSAQGLMAWVAYVMYWVVVLWAALVTLRIYRLLDMTWKRALALTVVTSAMSIVFQTHFYPQAWRPAYDPESATRKLMRLDQELFESQSRLLDAKIGAIANQDPNKPELYAIVYAPYAQEDVFMKEAAMVQGVLESSFAAKGRVISLVNNIQTTQTLAWATPRNLERSIQAIAKKMDKDNDVLLIYMTSHGASDFKLASNHWPLEVPALTPQDLASFLQQAGIKHRVVAISACYSGGWIDPLKADDALVMTAADATHTSYGCGSRSELTFFGRAMFDEALRKTHSFEAAFASAVPVIKQREEEAGKSDGFSNPQISVGAAIKPVLGALAAQWDKQP